VHSLTLDDAAGAITANGQVTISAGLSIAAGSLTVTAGSRVIASTLSNQGTIVANGVLNLTNSDAGSLARIGGSGALILQGRLDNVGGTLDMQSLASLSLYIGGAVHGGTVINFNNRVFLWPQSTGTLTLDSVQIAGSPQFMMSSSTLYVDNGLALTGASGVGPGMLTFDGAAVDNSRV